MAIAKVILNGDTLMDVTSNTVTSEGLLSGYTATKNDGTTVKGTTVGGPYYGIYDAIMRTGTVIASGNSTYKYTSEDVTNWINSYSQINGKTFQGIQFSGSFYFNNVTGITNHAFGFGYCYNGTGLASKADFYFPKLSSELYYGVFYENQVVSHISMPYCTSINSYALYSAYLQSAIFPACVIIGGFAFQNCRYLQEANFSVCTNIGAYAFNSCASLLSANFPECLSMSNYAFCYCSKLSSISFPKCEIIGSSAFYSCYSLQTISFSKCLVINNAAFRYCSGLTNINFSICTTISAYAFGNCIALTSINFPMCNIIGDYAFASCYSLVSASFPNCVSIKQNAFTNCTSLSTIVLPNCTSLGSYVFSNCYNLTQVNLPKVSQIGANTFQSCYNLISLYLLGSSLCNLTTLNAFNSTPISGYTTSTGGVYGSIFVPASLYNSYLTATNWSYISNRIVSV